MGSTTYAKRSVTIPAELVEQVVELIRDGQTFSSYVTAALQRQVERDRLREMVDEFDEEHGPADPAEVERWIATFAQR